MRAKLKGIFSDEFDPMNFSPVDKGCFYVTLRLLIGSLDSAGGDNFEVNVCTPRWPIENEKLMRWGRFLVIVSEYNYSEISDFVSSYIDGCAGDHWDEVALKLSRMFMWEFEDYVGCDGK